MPILLLTFPNRNIFLSASSTSLFHPRRHIISTFPHTNTNPPHSFIRNIHKFTHIRFMYGGCSSSGGFRGEPCTIQCVLAMGTIPTLQCKKCLCLFHPECVGLDSYQGSINHYICDVSSLHTACSVIQTAFNKTFLSFSLQRPHTELYLRIESIS